MLPSGGFFVKHSYRPSRASAALFALALLLAGAAGARAQTLSPTPDNLILQVTSTTIPAVPTPTPSPTATPTPSPTPTPTGTPLPVPRNSFAGDMSGNGRFVVIESEGDIATERTPQRNNADGNPEIFLFDYAQRRIFQITNTKSVLKDPTASPIDPTNIDVQVVNLKPVISHDGRFIVFVSNAYSDANSSLSPANFDGSANAAALKADGNAELFIYQIPQYPDADLTSGTEVTPVDLAAGTMTRVTFTPASSVPRSGATNVSPFFALDNDAPAVNDDASFVAFVSQARSGIPGESNADGNREIFIYNRLTGGFVQVTNTQDKAPTNDNPLGTLVFNVNPSLSGSGSVLAFISNADIGTSEAAANQGNGEIYVANFSGSAVSGLHAVTQTPHLLTNGQETGISVNLLNPGRRLSRDGKLLAFESLANFNADGTLPSTPLAASTGIYIYNIAANTFTQVANRPPSDQVDVGNRWPTFTGDSSRIVWSSVLNLKTDGTVLAVTDTTGLNPGDKTQVFSAPVSALNQISRLTNRPGVFTAIQPFPADDVRRIALSQTGGLLGTEAVGSEVFYVLTPNVTSETPDPSPTPAASPAPVSFFTGASQMPVVAPSPAPTPPAVSGLAPGELGVMTSTLTLAPAQKQVATNNAHEVNRRPPLPVELGGVSVSISGAAAGLYFVAPNQINFVIPPGLASSSTAQPVTVFNNGALIRSSVLLNSAQPDIFTSTNGPGGRAAVLNVTNPCVAPSGEPFAVTTTIPKGSLTTGNCATTDTESVPTRLLIMLTGVRGVTTTSSVTVTIGTTTITGTSDPVGGPVHFVGPSLTPGFDQIIVELPASLAGAGDVPVVVSVTTSGGTFTSRPADSAPHITIQ
jgi:uncharacterized protein (TIGR03437 family)